MTDNKLSELKRRADKCPIKRFKAFIGIANTQAILCADTGIEIIDWSGFDASDLKAKSHRVELARFMAAVDPETMLALLAEREAKDKRIAELEADETQLIQERDFAEAALSDMYEAATGERPEWSNWFGFADAVEEVTQVRAKLATPVRLPTAMFCPEEYVGSLLWSETEAHNKAISKCAEALRSAGFTVEGDE